MVVDLSKVFVQVRIPSAYWARVKPGAAVDVRVASLPDMMFKGKIARIGGQADPATGDVDALAEVTNENGLLRSGLACRSRVWLPEVADALVVPAAAIADRAGTPVVSVVRDGKGFEIEVKLGVQTQEKTQVIEGLGTGGYSDYRRGVRVARRVPGSVTGDRDQLHTIDLKRQSLPRLPNLNHRGIVEAMK